MTTDKELLELAAKAAGYFRTEYAFAKNGKSEKCWNLGNGRYSTAWNPLEDDGDAFRLAIDLGMLVDTTAPYNDTYVNIPNSYVEIFEPHNNDKYAATRRAIVRAAAYMMEENNETN